MLSKLRDLLDELNESEKVALAGGKYTTSNLREIRDLIAQWFASVNLALPEALPFLLRRWLFMRPIT